MSSSTGVSDAEEGNFLTSGIFFSGGYPLGSDASFSMSILPLSSKKTDDGAQSSRVIGTTTDGRRSHCSVTYFRKESQTHRLNCPFQP